MKITRRKLLKTAGATAGVAAVAPLLPAAAKMAVDPGTQDVTSHLIVPGNDPLVVELPEGKYFVQSSVRGIRVVSEDELTTYHVLPSPKSDVKVQWRREVGEKHTEMTIIRLDASEDEELLAETDDVLEDARKAV